MPVFDISAIRNLISIVREVTQTVTLLRESYARIQRLGKGAGNLARYRMPDIQTIGHDLLRSPNGAPFLGGLNVGDARGVGYFATVHEIQRDLAVLSSLPGPTQKILKSAYATIEIADSIAMMGIHQTGALRVYTDRLQESVRGLEQDLLSTRPEMQEMTAKLDLISVADSITIRQQMAANQFDSHILEQLIANTKRRRDDDAAVMNMRLNGLRGHGAMDRSLMEDDTLSTWRQP